MPDNVEFKSCGTTIRAHLYMPEGDGPFPHRRDGRRAGVM